MTETNDSRQHLIFAVLLGIAGLLIILIFVTIKSQADDTQDASTSAGVTNKSPTIDSLYITDVAYNGSGTTLDLTENTLTNVYIYGTYSDDNGCDEVATSTGGGSGYAAGVTTSLYRSGAGIGCTATTESCYTGISCNTYACTPGGTDTTGSFACTTTVQYYAEPTDSGTYSAQTWKATATSGDKYWDGTSITGGNVTTVGVASSTSSGVELSALVALGLGSDGNGGSIAYGSLALGGTSAADVTLALKNTGNVTMIPQVSGTAMTCSNGQTITAGYQKYATSTGVAYGSKKALTGSAVGIFHATNCFAVSTSTFNSTTNTQWMIQLPSTGIAGTCSGTNTVNSVACS